MTEQPLRVSVFIRFKEEERYLPTVLRALAAQRTPGASVRVVGINNESRDASPRIAALHVDRLIDVANYHPGQALNIALQEEECDIACILSAHAIPAHADWLASLLRHAGDPGTLGVYGAQLYPVHSRYLDKRDLDLFSTNEARIEIRDSDFWNANSLFPKASWRARQFDERVFELEDHHWTKMQLDGTNHVRFVPDALVYHYTHILRIDRAFLPPSPITNGERLLLATATLEDPAADWPSTMSAALTVKSLADHPGAREAIPALVHLMRSHPDFDVRWRVAGTLGKLPAAEGVQALIEALGDPSFYPRDEAAWALAGLGRAAVGPLMAQLDKLPRSELPLAALALGRSGVAEGEFRAVTLLDELMATEDLDLRRNAAYAAGEIDTARHLPLLLPRFHRILAAGDSRNQAVAAWALGALAHRLGSEIDWGSLGALAQHHPDLLVRTEAVAAIGKYVRSAPGSPLLEVLLAATRDPSGRVRYVAMQSLRLIAADGRRIPLVHIHSDDPDFGVRFEHELLTEALTGRPQPAIM